MFNTATVSVIGVLPLDGATPKMPGQFWDNADAVKASVVLPEVRFHILRWGQRLAELVIERQRGRLR